MTYLKLSVIMPNYNHAHYLEEALTCILAQSYLPMEIIIIDDASSDKSFEILETYAQRYPFIKVFRNDQNMGVNQNLTRLLDLAKGDYVYGAAADDKILPGFFEKSMHLLEQHPEAGLCSTLSLSLDAESKCQGIYYTPIVSKTACFIPQDKALSLLHKYGSWMQGNTVIYRRRALIESGGYIPELMSFSDGFICLVIAAKYGVCYIPEPLAAWRRLKNTYSSSINKSQELSFQIIRNTKALMCNQYRNVFPNDFVHHWEKKALLNMRLLHMHTMQNTAIEEIRQMIDSQDIIDSCFFGLRNLFAKLEFFILTSYLYRRMGLSVIQLYIQKIKQLWMFISNMPV